MFNITIDGKMKTKTAIKTFLLNIFVYDITLQDVPYLDLSTHPPRSRTNSAATAEQNEDKVSLCSMESVASRASHTGVGHREGDTL